MNQKKVLVAMSGGVDSSMTAYLLQQQGYEVEGVFFDLLGGTRSKASLKNLKLVEKKLGVKVHVIDLRAKFKKEVIEYFLREYRSGRTPNPCVVCNPKIKFGELEKMRKKTKADCIATGHYVKTKDGRILRTEMSKDQGYFLYRVPKEILQRAVFPAGEAEEKQKLYALAKKLGLGKVYGGGEDSQDVCFLEGKSLGDFLRKKLPKSLFKPGEIVDLEGKVLGKHEGILAYTIGQRKGLKIGGTGPWVVIKLDLKKNKIVVGREEDCLSRGCTLKQITWRGKKKEGKLLAQLRFRGRVIGGKLKGREFLFEEPQRAVTPGQSLVFLDQKEILGGGIIQSALK